MFGNVVDDDELSRGFMKTVVLLVLAFLVGIGAVTYLVTSPILGF